MPIAAAMPRRQGRGHGHAWLGCAVGIVLLGLMAGGAWLGVRGWRQQQRLLDAELLALVPFDVAGAQAEAAVRAAERLGCDLPLRAPSAAVGTVEQMVLDRLVAETDERFPARALAARVLAINRQFTPVRIGEEVTFQLKVANRTVTGIYRGLESQTSGIFVLVGQDKFRLADIVEEYHHRFSEGLANRLAREEIAALREDFETRRKIFVETRQRELTDRYFREAGYLPEGAGWRPVNELHAELSAALWREAERKFAAEREAEVARIIKERRWFGFLPVSPTVKIDSATPASPPVEPRPARALPPPSSARHAEG